MLSTRRGGDRQMSEIACRAAVQQHVSWIEPALANPRPLLAIGSERRVGIRLAAPTAGHMHAAPHALLATLAARSAIWLPPKHAMLAICRTEPGRTKPGPSRQAGPSPVGFRVDGLRTKLLVAALVAPVQTKSAVSPRTNSSSALRASTTALKDVEAQAKAAVGG